MTDCLRVILRRRTRMQRMTCATFLISISSLLQPVVDRSQAQTPDDNAAIPSPITRAGEKGPVSVELSIASDRVQAGSPFDVRIRIEAERGVSIAIPKIEGILGDFEVVEQTSKPFDCDVNHDCTEYVLSLRGYLSGEAEIPGLVVGFADPRPKMDGSNDVYQDTIQLESIPITVEESLADVKGPASLPIPWSMQLLWWGLGALAALAIVGLFVHWYRKRPKPISMAAPIPQLSAYDWAKRELQLLVAEDLMAKGRVQEFYYRINGLLRQYIERRFGLSAGEQTSEEFVRDIQSADLFDARQRETLCAFVASCDPVKYAKQQPTPDDVEWVLAAATDVIESTRHDAFVTANSTAQPAEVGA